MSYKLNAELLQLVRSFGGSYGPLGTLHHKLDQEIWFPRSREEGYCDWINTWEDVMSIFAEQFSKEDEPS